MVPMGQDWIHEIKHDGYRLIAQHSDKRVQLFILKGQRASSWAFF
jgi:bifunctional non-homologous end joining protein LigD